MAAQGGQGACHIIQAPKRLRSVKPRNEVGMSEKCQKSPAVGRTAGRMQCRSRPAEGRQRECTTVKPNSVSPDLEESRDDSIEDLPCLLYTVVYMDLNPRRYLFSA